MKPQKTKTPKTKSTSESSSGAQFSAAVEGVMPESPRSGEYLVTVEEGAEAEALQIFESAAGISGMLSTGTMSADEIAEEALTEESHGIFLSRLGVAVAPLDPDQLNSLRKQNGHTILGIEPAQVFFAIGGGLSGLSADYLRGYRDCADALLQNLAASREAVPTEEEEITTREDVTWGLRITRVAHARRTGKAVRVAILDTGIDLHHPDFVGRRIVHQSFIPGETVQDRNSHGTHCAGTACGPLKPIRGSRYGVAPEAELYIGKVLADGGSSRGRSVELGMEWALANRCHVISLSLGSPVLPGSPHSIAYERIGSRALRAGSLIVAAAGNNSARRRGIINPVSSPANCPSVLAVGAVDSGLNVADFSNGGINSGGGELNIAAPGVDVYSAVPGGRYGNKDGTSMAAPHVAGMAALWAEDTGKNGRELWTLLVSNARPLPHDSRDVGRGLIQGPSC